MGHNTAPKSKTRVTSRKKTLPKGRGLKNRDFLGDFFTLFLAMRICSDIVRENHLFEGAINYITP